MDDGEQIVAAQPLDDAAGVGTGSGRVGAEDVQSADRRIVNLAEQGRAEAIHVDARAGRRTVAPVIDRFVVPLEIVARAVGQTAAANAVLSRQRRQRADGPHVLAAVAIAIDAVGDLDEAGRCVPYNRASLLMSCFRSGR